MARLNLVLILIALACALSAVTVNHRARKLVTELEATQKHMRDLDVEWGQLQLEQSAWSTHAFVENVARARLHMATPVPQDIEIVRP